MEPAPFPRPLLSGAVATLVALVVACGGPGAGAQPLPSGESRALDRFRDGPGVIDSPSRGGNVFNNFPAFTIKNKDKDKDNKAKPPAPDDPGLDPSATGEAGDVPPPSRSESVTDRILREIEARKSIAKRRQSLSRARGKGAVGAFDPDPLAEQSAFAEIVGFGDEPEPLMPSTAGRERVDEEQEEAPTRPRSSSWRGRAAPDETEAPVERGLGGRSAIDASRRPMSGGVRAGAPAARSGWGQTTPRDGAAGRAAPKPLNAGRPIAPPVADERPTDARGGAAAGRPSTGRAPADRPARRPPLFPDRASP